jgi:hypothetical protein
LEGGFRCRICGYVKDNLKQSVKPCGVEKDDEGIQSTDHTKFSQVKDRFDLGSNLISPPFSPKDQKEQSSQCLIPISQVPAKESSGSSVYLAVKTINVPTGLFTFNIVITFFNIIVGIYDNCTLYGLFSEICILDRLSLDPLERVCQYLDCGMGQGHYYIILKQYACNLREWRLRMLQFEPQCCYDKVPQNSSSFLAV